MFGKNLKYYRLKNNMSMKELADLVQVSPMSISYYEKEERRPNMDIIKALARALHVRVTDFLAGSNHGYCHTGDVARRLPDGNYVIVGRSNDMIKINGNAIRPSEIEEAVK